VDGEAASWNRDGQSWSRPRRRGCRRCRASTVTVA
jgi:hypothetical protein